MNIFIGKWMAGTANFGQQVMRARYFQLVGSSRKELVHIKRIKDFQDKSLAKLLALFVTLGIAFGQTATLYLSRALFGQEECVAICNAA